MTITFYARPDGGHIHKDLNCTMLGNGDFEEMGYREVTLDEARSRGLICCACCKNVFGGRRRNPPKKGRGK